ncbi:nucleotidyltransferase family protein [Cohnella soli]|uniref:Nucleotidyltransferase family protein n=1 Tax=Cohnella soli TaxID=425005 RepID=A0ABW0HTB1_9BACL
MVKNEHRIIQLLIHPQLNNEDTEELKKLLETHMDWATVTGTIITHRVSGIAYRKMRELIGKGFNAFVYPRFYYTFEGIYKLQTVRSAELRRQTEFVCNQLEKEQIKYCVLKGLALSQSVYGDIGVRVSNDTDILVASNQIQSAIQLINHLGYVQGHIDMKSGEIVPASRRDLVIRPMVSHEVIPLLRKIDIQTEWPIHEIDLHFSLDLMTGNRTEQQLQDYLDRRIVIQTEQTGVYSLAWEDHLLFLCVHFYKEAAFDFEVRKCNDLSLYKLCDIAHMLSSSSISIDWDEFAARTDRYGMGKAVWYTLSYVEQIFGCMIPEHIMNLWQTEDESFLHTVYEYNKDKVIIRWTDTIWERVFNMNRAGMLDSSISLA